MIGRTLSHYKVLEKISRGGMGIVYRALDVKFDREVASKILPPELVANPERAAKKPEDMSQSFVCRRSMTSGDCTKK